MENNGVVVVKKKQPESVRWQPVLQSRTWGAMTPR
jgi:hypothetical protein